MKYIRPNYRILFIACLLLITMIGTSQTNIAVAPVKMNVLYIGVDNPLSVAAAGAADNNVTISIEGGGGIVSKTDAGLYNVKVTTATDDCTVSVYVDGKLAGSSKFRVRMLPQPFGSVGGYASGAYVAGDKFRSQSGIGIYVVNSPFEIHYEVVGFTVVMLTDKSTVKKINCDGALFSPDAKQYINQYVKRGDIVSIENIRVKGPNGELKIPAVFYNIE